MNPEGIVRQFVESEAVTLCLLGKIVPENLLVTLFVTVSESFGAFGSSFNIVGHTDSLAYSDTSRFDNWDLSVDRANMARRLLIESGFPVERIQEVSGRADTDLLVLDDPYAAQNRRISITLLKQD